MTKTDTKSIVRSRCAGHLNISPDQVEDDLIDFVTQVNGDVLLRARAGSGKTTAIGIKVSYMVNDLGVDPSKIVLLTFNNAAARGLEAKLSEFGVPPGVRVRTFHALAQRIVRAHFGGSRTCVFDDRSDEGQAIKQMMEEALDEVINEKFYFFCASKMRTHYGKRKDYVQSVGRDALVSAVSFLRARGVGIQNKIENAWDEGPIVGNAMKVIMSYEHKLRAARLLDATAVLQAAAWTLEREIETYTPKPSEAHDVDHIFIDEFQDVSYPYMRLVEAIRNINGMVNVQGVGDDWQAINGFAGADLKYFEKVTDHLDDPKIMHLLRNRRSGSGIVEWGNKIMRLSGQKNAPAIADPANGEGTLSSMRASGKSDLRYTAKKLADLADPNAKTIALIARRWKVGDHTLPKIKTNFEQFIRSAGINAKVTAITAHGSKGLEFDQVFVLDDGSFPLNHPARPIMEPLIPEADYEREEACLLHVAGTRAKQRLEIIDMS